MIQVVQLEDNAAWDRYVAGHPMANAYHASSWQKIIANTYGYKTYALAAVNGAGSCASEQPTPNVKGLLPLVHLKTPYFNNRLVSMPFFDHGGILADNRDCEEKLLQAALALGKHHKVQRIELRHLEKIASLEEGGVLCARIEEGDFKAGANLQEFTPEWSLRSHKVRLLLPLPDSSELLMKSFKSKLRSQIRRPIKAGLKVAIGGAEMLNDFYTVFSINMRDLGSPVHARSLLQGVVELFNNSTRVALVYKGDAPVAAALLVGFKNVMINPWASSLRQHSRESPNMLLYWSMLAYAADHGYRYFDFGRSTPDQGTYRFKVQWGAQPYPMYWYTIWLKRRRPPKKSHAEPATSRSKIWAVRLWQKLPLPLSRVMGPPIRKHIDL